MPFTKHVGRIVSTQQRVVVVFRQIPEEPDNCLLVDVEGLDSDMHNDLMNEVESIQAQEQDDFANHAHTHFFRDGRKMLETLHQEQKFIKLETNKVMMTPDANTNIRLDELNSKLNKFSYRVLKEDCLDLPDKVYMKRFVAMTPEQTKLYEEMKKHQF